jgi:hypothetical protein
MTPFTDKLIDASVVAYALLFLLVARCTVRKAIVSGTAPRE